VTWENTKRIKTRSKTRRDWHQKRIKEAQTAKQRLSARCQWLISEANLAGVLNDADLYIQTYIDELRKEAQP
jgi:hypothetical protein